MFAPRKYWRYQTARAVRHLEKLPLGVAGMMEFEFIPLGLKLSPRSPANLRADDAGSNRARRMCE
jgi:hypothetical protein